MLVERDGFGGVEAAVVVVGGGDRSPNGRDGHPVSRRRSEQRLVPRYHDEV
jgi:hypothetical protein